MQNYQIMPNENNSNYERKKLHSQSTNLEDYSGEQASDNFQNNHERKINHRFDIMNNFGSISFDSLPYAYISSTKCVIWTNSIANSIYILINAFFIFQMDLPFYNWFNVALFALMIVQIIQYIIFFNKIQNKTFIQQDSKRALKISKKATILYLFIFILTIILIMATADIPYPASIRVAILFMFYLILVAIYMVVRPIGIYVGNKKYKEAEMIIDGSITI